MKFILGKKLNMTQLFDETGKVTPVTVVQAGPVIVTQINNSKDGSASAVQIGFGEKKIKNVSKAVAGHTKAARADVGFSYLREFSLEGAKFDQAVGDVISADVFSEGESVVVAGITKGKGFQGVVKRHGFGGGRRSHGQKHSEREPGSIGATANQRVLKGVRMGGRMGSDRVSVKNLKVVKIDKENNLIFVLGAIPGRPGTLLEIVAK